MSQPENSTSREPTGEQPQAREHLFIGPDNRLIPLAERGLRAPEKREYREEPTPEDPFNKSFQY